MSTWKSLRSAVKRVRSRRVRAADGVRLIGVWRARYRDPDTGREWLGGTYRNVICVNGKSQIAAWLNAESPALSFWGAVGSGTTAPAATDTALQTELYRVAMASSSRGTNNVLIDFFYNTSQANAQLNEAGVFMAASSTPGSGQLLSHVAISENKVSTVTLTLEFSITVG